MSTMFSTSTREKHALITVEPMKKSEFQAIYLLIGFVAIISLFLFIIVLQLCKKSMSSKRQPKCSKKSDDNASHDEPLNQCNRRAFHGITDQSKDNSYLSIEVEYEEINDGLARVIRKNSTVPDEYERPIELSKISSIMDTHCCSTDEVNFGENVSEINAVVTDTYLQPIFVPGMETESK